MDPKEIEKIEVELLLTGIARRYGYDFRDYAPASLKRRLQLNLKRTSSKNYIELLDKILHDKKKFENLLCDLSVTVSEMFRDPQVYQTLRHYAVTTLKTYPFIKIWHAGCATGEEAYSMAIFLHEENLLERAHIYATDINVKALTIAKEGIYPSDQIKNYTKNYQAAGGKKSFSDYYHSKYGLAQMADFLKNKITFAYHNLAVDRSFSETQMIICRNVLIYFNQKLQDQVANLFDDSLSYGGFLLLGSKESLNFTTMKEKFKCLETRDKLYQKLYPAEESTHDSNEV